jgi:putative oxidoreductase
MATQHTYPGEQSTGTISGAAGEPAASDGTATATATAAAPSARATLRAWWERAWPMLRGPYPTLISRAMLGGVFLFSGVAKALDPTGFASDIKAYQMLPAGPIIAIMAYGLPLLEILLGVYLLAGLYLRWSAVVTGGLLIIFMIAMGQAVARGLQLQCGCFGAAVGASLRDDVSIWSILRDGVWLLMAAHLFFVPSIWTVDSRIRGGHRGGPTRAARATAPALPASPAPARPTSAAPSATRRAPSRSHAKRRR